MASAIPTTQAAANVVNEDSPTPDERPLVIDARAVMAGLCFESVYDAAGQVFTLRGADELNAFFDLADASGLCRAPVQRETFDFANYPLLIGTWTRAEGCIAEYEVVQTRRDDVARIFALALRLHVEGACGYELVAPYWVGVREYDDYDVRLIVQ